MWGTCCWLPRANLLRREPRHGPRDAGRGAPSTGSCRSVPQRGGAPRGLCVERLVPLRVTSGCGAGRGDAWESDVRADFINETQACLTANLWTPHEIEPNRGGVTVLAKLPSLRG